jgi:hypothetical protein
VAGGAGGGGVTPGWSLALPRAWLLACVLAGVMAVAACGKKGPPDPPGPPSEITWPRAYPTH